MKWPASKYLDSHRIFPRKRVRIHHRESMRPILLVQIHQHFLFQFIFAIADADGIVVAVQAVNQCLNAGFVEVSNVAGGLARFLTQHHGFGGDESESVNDNFSFHRLNWINHNGNCTWV